MSKAATLLWELDTLLHLPYSMIHPSLHLPQESMHCSRTQRAGCRINPLNWFDNANKVFLFFFIEIIDRIEILTLMQCIQTCALAAFNQCGYHLTFPLLISNRLGRCGWIDILEFIKYHGSWQEMNQQKNGKFFWIWYLCWVHYVICCFYTFSHSISTNNDAQSLMIRIYT